MNIAVTAEQLKTIEYVAGCLSRKYAFGYFTEEDIKQEAIILGMEAMKSYDNGRPLENFLWKHIANRLINLKRDNFMRPQKPCVTCPLFQNSKCTKYEHEMDCSLFSNWRKRNDAKGTLASSFGFGDDEPDKENGNEINIEGREILQKIDRALPVEYRENWIRFTNGLKLSKQKKDELILVIKNILGMENTDAS